MSKVIAFMAEGMEEAEFITVTDILMRGGVEVRTASVSGDVFVKGAHGVVIKADSTFDETDFADSDMLFLPGGMPGVTNLEKSKGLCALLKKFAASDKRIAAICAAPGFLGKLGLLKDKTAACYPGFEKYLEGANYTPRGVVTDGNISTSRGLGFAVDFGLELVRLLEGPAVADRVSSAIQRA